MRSILAVLLAVMMAASLFLAGGCSKPAADSTDTGAETASTTGTSAPDDDPNATITFVDDAGRTVEIPKNITKVSPSGQLAQMFLIAVAPESLCTIASEYSPNVQKYVPQNLIGLPVVGQFYGTADINLEEIAKINPQIVIDVGEPKKTIVEDLDSITAQTGIPAIHITASLTSTPDAFRKLGKLLGQEAQGEAVAQWCEKALGYKDTTMSKVGENKTSVLYCLGDNGTNVLPATSFHSEMLDSVGNNLAVVESPANSGMGNESDLEQISLWNPEVIFFAPQSVYASAATNPAWSQLQAISSGRYYEVPFGPYNWMGSPPSINRYLGMLWMMAVLYPDDINYVLKTEVTEYYKLFYGYTLTDSDYAGLTANALPK
jgi:iron complex transport system substrate-binding protein